MRIERADGMIGLIVSEEEARLLADILYNSDEGTGPDPELVDHVWTMVSLLRTAAAISELAANLPYGSREMQAYNRAMKKHGLCEKDQHSPAA